MKLLRHILSHLILISFLIAVVSVFYYRTLLLPAPIVEKIDQVTNDVYPPALTFVSKRDYFWSIKGERIVSFDDLNLFEQEDNKANKKATSPLLVAEKTEATTVEPEKVVKPEILDAVDIEVKSDQETVVAVVTEIKKPLPELKDIITPDEKDNNEIAEKASVVTKDSDTSSERDLLIKARNTFNQGDVKLSEALYLELTQLEQDNPDNFGELGNVYYSQGKWDEAGQAYYQAAVRLISEGNHEQVAYLQRVIKGLNAEHAEKLSQQMMRR